MSANNRMLFVNLCVRDLQQSIAFFKGLGFEFNPNFTDENAACLIIGEASFAMLLTEKFFRTFTKREPADTTRFSEVLLAVSCTGREEVKALVQKAFELGATPAMPPQDHGFMYVETFYDLDGHHWEFAWMDPAAAQ